MYAWNLIIDPQKLPAHTPLKHLLVSSSFSEQCFKSKVGIALGWKFRVRFLCPFPHVLLHELQDDHGVSISLHDAVMPPKIHISVNLYLYGISIYYPYSKWNWERKSLTSVGLAHSYPIVTTIFHFFANKICYTIVFSNNTQLTNLSLINCIIINMKRCNYLYWPALVL